MQRVDGAFGPLIVRVPDEENPHKHHYDFDLSEHVMVIIDWNSELGIEMFLAHHHNDGTNKSPTILINGLGRFKTFYGRANKPIYTPPARFKVKQVSINKISICGAVVLLHKIMFHLQ